jgi:hypothetical protein
VEESISKDCCPQKDSIDSLIFCNGELILSTAFYKACMLMFPEKKIMLVDDAIWGRIVVLVEDKVLFDLYAFYYDTNDGSSICDDVIRRLTASSHIYTGSTWVDTFCCLYDTVLHCHNFDPPTVPENSAVYDVVARVVDIGTQLIVRSHSFIIFTNPLTNIEKRYVYDALKVYGEIKMRAVELQANTTLQWNDPEHLHFNLTVDGSDTPHVWNIRV